MADQSETFMTSVSLPTSFDTFGRASRGADISTVVGISPGAAPVGGLGFPVARVDRTMVDPTSSVFTLGRT